MFRKLIDLCTSVLNFIFTYRDLNENSNYNNSLTVKFKIECLLEDFNYALDELSLTSNKKSNQYNALIFFHISK